MGFWGWLQAIAAGWFVLSILLGVAWALIGRRIFRRPPNKTVRTDNLVQLRQPTEAELREHHARIREGER